MAETFDLIVRGGTVVNHEGGLIATSACATGASRRCATFPQLRRAK